MGLHGLDIFAPLFNLSGPALTAAVCWRRFALVLAAVFRPRPRFAFLMSGQVYPPFLPTTI